MVVHVTCPKCGSQFDAATSLHQHVEAAVAGRLAAQQQQWREAALAEAREAVRAEAQQQTQELAAARQRLQAAQQREAEVLRQQAELDQRAREQGLEVARQVAAEREKWAAAAKQQAEAEAAVQLQARQEELLAARRQLQEAQAREAELVRRRNELDERAQRLQLDVQQQVAAEREKWAAAAKQQAQAEAALQLKAQQEEAEAARRARDAAIASELELRKQKAALEDAARAQELVLRQQLDQERASIQEAARRQAAEAAALRDQENEARIRQLKESLEEAQRRLAQGSQQAQGEAQEIVLEQVLRQAFPRDGFAEVGKGVEGADLVQTVRDEQGRDCGTILWESKRTKNWSPAWIGKLAGDRARQNAHVAALVSQALPPDVLGIGCVEDVWVCSFGQVTVLSALLRRGVLEAAAARLANAGRADKMELVYTYLTGPEFRNRAQSMVQALNELRAQLDRERQAMQKIWAQRERLMQLAVGGIAGMRNDLQAIAGADLTALPSDGDGLRELEEVAGAGAEPLPAGGDGAAEEAEFLAALARAGGSSGNIRLRGELGWDEPRYERAKAGLLRRGAIALGAGRGGSVKLAGGPDGGAEPGPDGAGES